MSDERMEKALRDIETWARAYPVSVFHEPSREEHQRAAALLRENGMTLDAFSASAMRHVLDGIINIVKDGLRDD